MSDFKYYRNDNFPPIVKNLIIINVLVYIAQLTLEKSLHLTQVLSLYPAMPQSLHDLLVTAGYFEPGEEFHPYQIATHMFAHSPSTFMHILFNMFGLWMFGKILENVWGGKKFLMFYLICGVGAALCHLGMEYYRCSQLLNDLNQSDQLRAAFVNHAPEIIHLLAPIGPALGASGAIMGIFAAFGYLFPNTPLYVMFIPIPVKAKWVVMALAAYDLFGGLTSMDGDNVAHFAHLGGAVTGFILVLIWNKTNRRTFY